MKIADVLLNVRGVKPHQYDDATVIRWLSDLDGKLMEDLFSAFEDANVSPVLPYQSTDLASSLLIPAPHEDIYIKYVCAQIDYHNGEFDRYQNGMIMFQTQLQGFQDAYTRTHKPKSRFVTGIKGDFA